MPSGLYLRARALRMECELIENCQHDMTLPNPSERQHYGLHLPSSTQSLDLTLVKVSMTGGLSSKVDDYQQEAQQTTYNRRETPEGFTVAYNPENSSNQLDFISESETSFLSPIPNEHFKLRTLTLSQCEPIVENNVRNAKSSIDFLTDINNENLMIKQSKCYTPNVCITQNLSSSSLKKKAYSASQTLPYFDEKQQTYTYTELDVIPDNHDVLKWDYAGDIASNHLNISRIISHSNLSSYPVNCNDCGKCNVSMTLTWHSSDPYLSPSSRNGYTIRRKYDITRINSDKNWSESPKKNGFPELSSTVVNHGSFISSPDPEDEEHTLPNLHLLDNHFLRCQSSLNCLDVDILEDLENDEDLVKCNVSTNSSKSSLNDVNVCENTERFNLKTTNVNLGQSMTKIQNHADNVLKATKASVKRLRQHLDTVGEGVNVSETMNSNSDKYLRSKAPEPYCRTKQTFKSNDIDYQTTLNDVSNEANIPANNNDEQKALENNSMINDLKLPKEFNEEYNDDDSQLSLHHKHDLFSPQTTSVSDDVDSDTFQCIQDNITKKELSIIQQPANPNSQRYTYLNYQCHLYYQSYYIIILCLLITIDSNNYSAITTVTPLNENINNEDGFNGESESFRSSVVIDENYEKEMLTYHNVNQLDDALETNKVSVSVSKSVSNVNDYKISVTNEESISNNSLLTAEHKLLSNDMDGQLSNNYPSTLTSGICITTHLPDHKHYPTSKIESNKLPEYIPSVYSNLSKTVSLPKCYTVFSHMNTSSTKQDLVNQTNTDKTKNKNLQRTSHMLKASTTKTIDSSCYNLHQKKNRLPLISHHCHVQSTVIPVCNAEISFNELSPQNIRSQVNENTRINKHLTCCKPYLTGSVMICSKCIEQSSPVNHQMFNNAKKINKLESSPVYMHDDFRNSTKRLNNKLALTTDLCNQNDSSSLKTYRIQPSKSECLRTETSSLCYGLVRKLHGSNTEHTSNAQYPLRNNKPEIVQSVDTSPRSTLVTQLRYILLKQKLKLLRTRDAYYLRRRIVKHLEKFLEQIMSSDTLPLTNSIPDDWDTDTVSLLSTDLLDKDIISNNHHMHKSIVVSNNVKCEDSQQMKLLTDGFIEKAKINKEMLTERSSSFDRAHFEVSEMDVHRFDNPDCMQNGLTVDKIECLDDNEQLRKIRNHEQDQSCEGVMHFEVSQPSIHPSSTCTDLNKSLSTFLHPDCHDNHKEHCEQHVYPSSKNMMGVACAALGGISWFQPLHGCYVNGKIKKYSKNKTSKLNDNLKNIFNTLNNTDLHNISHITNDPIKSTCEVLHHAPTNNHLVSYDDIHAFNSIHYFNSHPFHNEVNDIYSNDSTIKESHEMTVDKNQGN
ncbi:hypothetical protein MN116_007448, partial [Schistosoma mekongi]